MNIRIASILTLALIALAHCRSGAADTSWEPYFPADYDQARARFREAASTLAAGWPGAEQARFHVPSARDSDLTVDSLYLPALGQPKQLIVMLSGVHGMEGFAGSAAQLMFLREMGPQLDRRETGYLVVHALNPFGFKHHRRSTENNVNLNRNFSTKPELYQTANAGYGVLKPALEPAGAVSGIARNSWALALEIGRKLIAGTFSMGQLNEAIGQGQYASPRGLEYGGAAAEPQVADFLAQLAKVSRPYRDLILLDLHTGLGAAHQLHLMPGDAEGVFDRALFARAFDIQADADLYAFTPNDTAGFYRTHGDVNNVLAEIRQPGQRVIGLTLEFGTVGESAIAKLSTLNRLVLENQGFQAGYATEALRAEVDRLFSELFFPGQQSWRRNVIARARGVFTRALERLAHNA